MSATKYHPTAKSSIEEITPELAQELLGSNIEHQRSIGRANLLKIESDMKNERFKLNGEPIIVGVSGKLLDGQHRLCACVNTKKPFWSVVVRGIDDENFNIINIGKSRTLPDVLKIAGEANTVNLAATLVKLVQYTRDAKTVGGGTGKFPVSTSEAFDMLSMMPGVRDSVAANCYISSGEVISCARVAWLHCLAFDQDSESASSFFEKMQSGEMLKSDNPIFIFRARMMADKLSNAKLPTREVIALLIKTWNAYAEGKSVKLLQWRQDEAFPILNLGK